MVGISCRRSQSDSVGPFMTDFFSFAWSLQVYAHYSIYQNFIPLTFFALYSFIHTSIHTFTHSFIHSVHMHLWPPWCTRGGLGTTCGRWFSLSIMRVRIELELSDLLASTFTNWDDSSALQQYSAAWIPHFVDLGGYFNRFYLGFYWMMPLWILLCKFVCGSCPNFSRYIPRRGRAGSCNSMVCLLRNLKKFHLFLERVCSVWRMIFRSHTFGFEWASLLSM